METCLDEGTLQAYLDGELSPETAQGVAAHLDACAACATAAGVAEQEFAFFSTTFADALPASVPTEKLRARLDAAIAELNAPQRAFAPARMSAASRLRSFFDALVASLTTFTPRQATAFASFLVAAALVVVFALMQTPDDENAPQQIARVTTETPAAPTAQTGSDSSRVDGGNVAAQSPDGKFDTAVPSRGVVSPKVTENGGATRNPRPRSGRGGAREAVDATANANIPDATVAANTTAATESVAAEPVLADEKTYLSSIASLTSAIEAQGQEGMTPTLRAEYERNLAVVNQAIVASRVAARRNPQDTDAKEFLRTAYQNKVELLSAIADQTQLASGRD